MSDPGVIAVTGATGQLGGRVAKRLGATGAPMRLVVRDVSRAPTLPDVPVMAATYGDQAGMAAALDGVDTLLLVSASESADRVPLHTAAVDAAIRAGVSRLVYVSFLAAAPEATFTFARDHFHTEAHIRRTGVPFTFLRDSLYLDVLPGFVGADLVIRGPAGTGALAGVCRDDVADVAVRVLTDDAYAGATYDLTGPLALTMDEIAMELTRYAGREIGYRAETMEEAVASRAHYGAPEWEVTGWISTYSAIAAGELSVVSTAVKDITGREPLTFPEYLAANPEAWAHLRA